MSTSKWTVTFQVYRQKGQQTPHFDRFTLEVDPDEYVLDAIERIWAFHDHSLCFRHACHHSTCGACGMRINGVEKLTCITPIRDVTHDKATVKVEPLRNFPVESDLAVDMGLLFLRMELSGHRPVVSLSAEPVTGGIIPIKLKKEEDYIHLSDCIECGLCISACPIVASSSDYIGPAVLAGAQQRGVAGNQGLMAYVDGEDGAWRCHSAFECTSVCPSNVDPARRIMDLRRQIVGERFRGLFRS